MADEHLESNLLPETPETRVEQSPDTAAETPEGQESVSVEQTLEQEAPVSAPEVHEAPVAQPAAVKDEMLQGVESILSADLTEIYLNLPKEKRPAFKLKGEQVAHQVKQMLESGKAQAYKILDLILGWLRMIPGVNRFYLEKDAEMKTKRLLLEFALAPVATANAI
jgi:hypothetical protein